MSNPVEALIRDDWRRRMTAEARSSPEREQAKCIRTGSMIGSDAWKREPACDCRACGPSSQRHELVTLRAQVQALEQELARWKVCSLCGQEMEAPGACSDAERERKEGYELMHEQALSRAEAAEAKVQALTEERDKAKSAFEYWHGEAQATDKRLTTLAAVVRGLVAKLDECQPYINSAFVMSHIHGGHYNGPTYGVELDAVRAALPKEGQP